MTPHNSIVKSLVRSFVISDSVAEAIRANYFLHKPGCQSVDYSFFCDYIGVRCKKKVIIRVWRSHTNTVMHLRV